MSRTRRSVLVAIWCVALLVAAAADGPVARWARASGVAAVVASAGWAAVVKAPGTFWFTAVIVGALWAARRIDFRRALYVLAVAATAGLSFVVKWVVGRTRPFKLPPDTGVARPFVLHPMPGGIVGLFVQPKNLSFPSGHECTAAALAAGVWVVYRPGGRALVPVAVAVGVERVLENAHYVSDVVAAAGLAVGGAWVAWAIMGTWVAEQTRAEEIADPLGDASLAGRRPPL